REVRRHVGLASRVRLHVGVLGAEERLGAIARGVFDVIHFFAAAVVALAGISLRVLVGRHRPHRRENGEAHEILGGNHLQSAVLPPGFGADVGRDAGIGTLEVLEQFVHWLPRFPVFFQPSKLWSFVAIDSMQSRITRYVRSYTAMSFPIGSGMSP